MKPTQLPGFGRPVNYYQEHGEDAFPSSLNQIDMDEEERTV